MTFDNFEEVYHLRFIHPRTGAAAGGPENPYGYPVKYSASMPVSGQLSSPIVFGDFKQGYLIGDRGGAAINVKVLDQVKAAEGILPFLGYRRTDGRVRRTEALKRYVIDSGS